MMAAGFASFDFCLFFYNWILSRSMPRAPWLRPALFVWGLFLLRVAAQRDCEAWLDSLHYAPARRGDTSQGRQGSVLRGIFDRIGATNRVCVEFGFGYGSAQSLANLTLADLTSGNRVLSGLNTQGLIMQGWHPTFFDPAIELPNLKVRRALLTRANIANEFRKAGIPIAVDYVSIDVDSIDAWLFLGLLAGGYRPRVISVEYNMHFRTDMLISCEERWHKWTGKSVYGASAGVLNLIAEMFDYHLVTIVRGLDLFFVRRDVLDL